MLVLTRKLHEAIVVGDAIRVSVLAVRGGQVRLGIEAPGDVRIVREELRAAPAHDAAPAPVPAPARVSR
jgi:carbon storage regulator